MKTFLRSTSIALAVLAAVAASASPAGAQTPATLFVCAEAGACQFSSIQAAVDAAKAGDTIRVRSGLYFYKHVTIPAGKDGLTLLGAQAGVAANTRPIVGADGESFLHDDAGTAVSVASSGVTLDGFVFAGYDQGVWSTASTSGLQVLNTQFSRVGNSVIPDSNGEQETVIRNNSFDHIAVDRGAAKGFAIVTGASHGRLVVAGNVITGEGALLAHFGVPAHDVRVEGNHATDSGFLAQLESVDGAVIEGNVVDGPESRGLALLFDTRDVAVKSNVVTDGARYGVYLGAGGSANRDLVIEANDFSGFGQQLAVFATRDSVVGALVARYNRFATGAWGVVARGPVSVDARYNWWGCNAGANQPECAWLERSQGATVRTVPQLTLSIETAGNRIENASGGTTTFRASLLRDSDGTVHEPARFPRISFRVSSTSGSRVADLAQPHPGVFSGTLVADGGQGAYVEALVDGAEVRTHVDFGPAAGPAPGPAAMPAPQPAGPVAAQTTNACRASARTLTCVVAGKAGRALRARGVKATLYRAGRRIATGSVRVSGGKVQLRVGRRVAAGRYTLVVMRAGRRLARQAVVVTTA